MGVSPQEIAFSWRDSGLRKQNPMGGRGSITRGTMFLARNIIPLTEMASRRILSFAGSHISQSSINAWRGE